MPIKLSNFNRLGDRMSLFRRSVTLFARSDSLPETGTSNDAVCSNGEDNIFGNPTSCPREFVGDRRAELCLNGTMTLDSSISEPEVYRRASYGPVVLANVLGEQSNVFKKLESIRIWSLNTFKCTKQVIEEKLGTATPTWDEKLDLRIQTLKQMQKQYQLLLETTRQFAVSFAKTIQTQRNLAGQLASLGQQQPELSVQFVENAELHKSAVLNGEKLLLALESVCCGLSTLVHQTFDDTMLTIKNMNMARIEFDAYRKEVDTIRNAPQKTNQINSNSSRRLEESMTRFLSSQTAFLRLKSAVDAKMRLLHENRIRVMQHQLRLLHSAIGAFYSGNVFKLDEALKSFNVTMTSSFKYSKYGCENVPVTSTGSPAARGKPCNGAVLNGRRSR